MSVRRTVASLVLSVLAASAWAEPGPPAAAGDAAAAAAPPAAAGAAAAPPARAASAEAGRALFIGARRFAAGGAPCGACHALAGEGLAFTASLGPALAGAIGGMDADALDGLLQTLPFPTMAPIYDGHALTAAERADLAAYLVAAASRGAPQGRWRFEAWGLGGAALLFLGLVLASRRRKPPTRARLLARAAAQAGGSR